MLYSCLLYLFLEFIIKFYVSSLLYRAIYNIEILEPYQKKEA